MKSSVGAYLGLELQFFNPSELELQLDMTTPEDNCQEKDSLFQPKFHSVYLSYLSHVPFFIESELFYPQMQALELVI